MEILFLGTSSMVPTKDRNQSSILVSHGSENILVDCGLFQGLKELLEAHNFKVEKILGAGYYPLPGRLARILSKIDKRHAAFLTIKVRKQL